MHHPQGGRGGRSIWHSNGRGGRGGEPSSTIRTTGHDAVNTGHRSYGGELSFGLIISVLENFGFIQTYEGDGNVYFSVKDVPGMQPKVGDEVSFYVRSGARGLVAMNIKTVDAAHKVVVKQRNGEVLKEPDNHRHLSGSISFIDNKNQQRNASLTYEDAANATSRVCRGDEIKFTLETIPGTNYCRAKDIVLVQSKRDRLLKEQIQGMYDMGIPRSQGIVDTIKGDYGFIRRVDHPDHIYFRVDDVIDEGSTIFETTEVEFFVICENSKGKMSDRAVHLSVIPKGTIQFEVKLGENCQGTVIKEPKAHPREEPGIIKLHNPVTKVGDSIEIYEIELWPRCLSENMILKIGDLLKFDVKHYRPDDLIFARDISIQSYRKIGREIGVVCPLKDQKFGFVTCLARGIDAYFRLGEVINYETGNFLKESEIFADMTVSFDVTLEEIGRAGVPRLKAIRVRQEEKQLEIQRILKRSKSDDRNNKSTATSSVIVKGNDDLLLLKSDLRGTVAKEPRKEQTGAVELDFDASGVTKEEIDAPLNRVEAVVHDSRLLEAVQEFVHDKAMTELILDYQTSRQRRALHLILTDLFQGIAHETIEISDPPTSGPMVSLRSVRLWKCASMDEFNAWTAKTPFFEKCKQDLVPKSITAVVTEATQKDGTDDGKSTVDSGTRMKIRTTLDWDPKATLPFTGSDYDGKFGPMMKDLKVSFDVYFDRASFKRVAKNVCMTDEAIDDIDQSSIDPALYDNVGFTIPSEVTSSSSSSSMGILEVIRGGSFGFIRKIADDEKLFWNQSSLLKFYSSDQKIEASDLQEGRPVLFAMRKRGGFRCAVDIQLLEFGALRGYSTLKDKVHAIAIGEGNFVLTDVSSCPLLHKKVANLRDAIDTFQKKKGNNESSELPAKKGIKYFMSLHSTPLTVKDDPSDVKELPVGTLVTCQAVVDWAYQRFPLSLTNLEVDNNAPPLPAPPQNSSISATTSEVGEDLETMRGRRRGFISKLKIEQRNFDFNITEISEVAKGKAMSVVEALEATSLSSGSCANLDSTSTCDSPNIWYCDTREFGRNVQQGDEVDFIPVPGSSIAIDVKVKPSSLIHPDTVFKRTVVNAALKSKVPAKITMAEGPPSEHAIGFVFPEGRNYVEDISCLPWAHLLQQPLESQN